MSDDVAASAWITIQADQIRFRISDLMIGANMEDLHYQMTGGLSSQLIHGESFFEPTPTEVARRCQPFAGFTVREGNWILDGEVLRVGLEAGQRAPDSIAVPTAHGAPAGARLSSDDVTSDALGAVVELRFPPDSASAAGLALCIHPNEADEKWSWFSGYMAKIDSATQQVILTRASKPNRHVELAKAPCAVEPGCWMELAVSFDDGRMSVTVDGQTVLAIKDPFMLPPGRMGLVAHGDAEFRNLREIFPNAATRAVGFRPNPKLHGDDAISLRWAAVRTGSAEGAFSHAVEGGWHPGKPSQTITFLRGEGEVGIDNAGLVRWGLSLAQRKPLNGFLRVKSQKPADLYVSLRSRDGDAIFAAARLTLLAGC